MKNNILDIVIDPIEYRPSVIESGPGFDVYLWLAGLTVVLTLILVFSIKKIKKLKEESL